MTALNDGDIVRVNSMHHTDSVGPKYCVSKCLEFLVPTRDSEFQHALRAWGPKETDRVGELLGELSTLRGKSNLKGVRGYAVYNERTMAKQLGMKLNVLKEEFLKPDSVVHKHYKDKIGQKGAPIGFVMTVNTSSGYDGHCYALKFLTRETHDLATRENTNAVVYSPDEGVQDLVPLVHGITKILNIWGLWVVENVPASSTKKKRKRARALATLRVKKMKIGVVATDV